MECRVSEERALTLMGLAFEYSRLQGIVLGKGCLSLLTELNHLLCRSSLVFELMAHIGSSLLLL